MKVLSKVVVGAGFALLSAIATANAQDGPEAEVTLRPGDAVIWEPTGRHGLRFGGTVEVEGTKITLTDWATIQTMLDFGGIVPDTTSEADQAQFPDGNSGSGTITATVRANADDAVAPSFVFTCVFNPHADQMTSVTFKIVPRKDGEEERTVTIGTPDGVAWWIIKGGGNNIPITPRPPVPGA